MKPEEEVLQLQAENQALQDQLAQQVIVITHLQQLLHTLEEQLSKKPQQLPAIRLQLLLPTRFSDTF